MNSQKRAKKRPLVEILSDRRVKKTRTGLGSLGDYKTLARWIGRCEDTFINFIQVFAIGMNEDFPATDTDDDDEEHDDDDDATPEDEEEYIQHHLRIYTIISERIKTFSTDIKTLSEREDQLHSLCEQMNAALSISRSDDIRSLREIGLSYVAALQPNKVLLPPIPPNSSKEDYRGWNHAVLAELLCPIEHIAAFRKDPSGTCQKFQDGTLTITSDQLALYMYRGQRVNVERIDDGLMCSELIKLTWRHLFQSSRSVAEGRRIRTKRGIADYNEITTVTPRTIAYATIHTRWFLCGLDDWRSDELDFSKDELFNTVLDLFKQEVSGSWAKATLEEWNIEMFPKQSKRPGTRSTSLATFYSHCRGRTITTAPPSPSVPKSPVPPPRWCRTPPVTTTSGTVPHTNPRRVEPSPVDASPTAASPHNVHNSSPDLHQDDSGPLTAKSSTAPALNDRNSSPDNITDEEVSVVLSPIKNKNKRKVTIP
ncbi:hypothetical protein BGW80DRAFT_1462134 [Lactifluus volemus]|nr:hypothetical protein BGW80DRAFT_1462134 [Lactifluus volemus]